MVHDEHWDSGLITMPQSFSVHWKDEGTGVQSCAFISLDGFVVPARFLQGGGETSREGVRTGPDTERPFVFAEQGENTSEVVSSCPTSCSMSCPDSAWHSGEPARGDNHPENQARLDGWRETRKSIAAAPGTFQLAECLDTVSCIYSLVDFCK